MKAPSLKSQQALVARINETFQPGDKVIVKMDQGNNVIWTLKAPASLLGGHTAVIWCNEHPSCYLADRLQIGIQCCKVCGCTDRDCSQCIEASGVPCHWVAPRLCSRCKAEQEAARS